MNSVAEFIIDLIVDGDDAIKGVKDFERQFSDALKGVKESYTNAFKDMKSGAGNFARGLTLENFQSKFAEGFNSIREKFKDVLKDMANNFINFTNGLRFDNVKSGITNAFRGIKNGIASTFNGFKAQVTEFGRGFTFGFTQTIFPQLAALFSLGAVTDEYVSKADSYGKIADALNLDVEALHAWSEASARAGGSAEEFQGSLQRLTGQLSKQALTGNSRAGAILQAAGIDAGEIGRQRDALNVLMDLAEKAEEMNSAEFFGFAESLGIDRGTIMLLQQGRDAVREAILAQKEFGLYTKEDVLAAANFNDAVDNSRQSLMGVASVVLRDIIPVFTKILEGFQSVTKYLQKHSTAVKAFFYTLAAVITAVAIPSLMSFSAALLTNPITLVLSAIAALALVIEDLIVWAEGGKSALGDFWAALFGSPEEALQTWESIKRGAADLWETVKKGAVDLWGFLKPYFARGGEFIMSVITSVIKFVKDGIKTLSEFVDKAAGAYKSVKRFLGFNDKKEIDNGGAGGKIPAPMLAADMNGLSVDFDVDAESGINALEAFKGSLSSIGTAAGETASKIGAWITGTAGSIGSAIIGTATAAANKAAEIGTGIMGGARVAYDFLLSGLEKVNSMFTSVKNAIISGVSAIAGAFFNLANTIISALGGAFNWIVDKWNGITSIISGAALSVGSFATAAEATRAGGGGYYSNNESSTDINVGQVNIQTQATDADGIARDIGGAFRSNFAGNWAAQASVGVT